MQPSMIQCKDRNEKPKPSPWPVIQRRRQSFKGEPLHSCGYLRTHLIGETDPWEPVSRSDDQDWTLRPENIKLINKGNQSVLNEPLVDLDDVLRELGEPLEDSELVE